VLKRLPEGVRLENFCQPARALSERSLSAHPG
jgi:hypothetical protein